VLKEIRADLWQDRRRRPRPGRASSGSKVPYLRPQHRLRLPGLQAAAGPFGGRETWPNGAEGGRGEGSSSIRRKVPEVLNLVGLAHKMSSLPDELSGGEAASASRFRARPVVNHPPLLILRRGRPGTSTPDTSVGIMQLLYRINSGRDDGCW